MITKLKKLIVAVAAIAVLGAPALFPVAVYANAADDAINGGVNCGAQLDLTTADGDCAAVEDGADGLQALVIRVINIFSIIVGIVAVIMIIVGGLKYITSGGESSNVSGAKNTIIYAIIGLIVVALAQFIVRFVLGNTNNIAG